MSEPNPRESVGRREAYGFALGFRFLTGHSDPLIRWFLREGRVKRELVYGAGLRPGDAVLDTLLGPICTYRACKPLPPVDTHLEA